jgi:hypothetical protein
VKFLSALSRGQGSLGPSRSSSFRLRDMREAEL